MFIDDLLTTHLKTRLLNAVVESKSMKENLTFLEQLDLCNHILEMKLDEMKPLFLEEDIRAFQSKMSKFLKYGLAGLAGMYLGVGMTFGMVAIFLFRKQADPCWRRCLDKFGRPQERDLCKYDCLVDAANMVVQELRKEISRCNDMPDPVGCQKKLQSEYIKWAQRLQKYTVKLKKVQFNLQGKALKQTTSNIAKNAQARVRAGGSQATGGMGGVGESIDPKKQERIHLVETSKILRKSLSFRDHVKLYNRVRAL
jgi:hypothetical protein